MELHTIHLTIQLLHCIKNDSVGGRSTLTDGFAVSNYLRKKYPNYFKLLSTINFLADSILVNTKSSTKKKSVTKSNKKGFKLVSNPKKM